MFGCCHTGMVEKYGNHLKIRKRRLRAVGIVSSAAILGLVGGCSSVDDAGVGGDTASHIDIERAATGDITAHGGARRLSGDQTRMIADSIHGPGPRT
jgi:alkaline phosphatase